MAEYIERETAIDFVLNNAPHINGETIMQCVERAIEKVPAADGVPMGAYKQVLWERDIAMGQLKEHGIPFGGEADVVEVVRCKDCKHWGGVLFGQVCKRWSGTDLKNHTQPMDYCSCGERKDGAE